MTSKTVPEAENQISSASLKFLYIFENKTIEEHIIEVKRIDVTSNNPKDKYFWLVVSGKYIRRLSFLDSGKLNSGKEVRILGDEYTRDGNDYPWILTFDDKILDLHRTDWEPSTGKYVKIKPDDISNEAMVVILKYFGK